MNICPACHIGRLKKRSMVYMEWHGETWLVVDRMPALVCDICDEQTYDPDALEYLQQLLWFSALTGAIQRPISTRVTPEMKQKAA